MRGRHLWAIAAATLAHPASAELQQVAPGRYICDAAAGTFHRQDVSGFFGNNQFVAARIRLVSAYPGEHSSTYAGFDYTLDSGQVAQMLVYAPPSDANSLWIILKPPGADQATAMLAYRRARTIELAASMSGGAIFVRVGNERGQMYVGDAHLASRELHCTGGRFEIELTLRPRHPDPYH